MVTSVGQAQLTRCTPDSPERRGEPGCSIVADQRLPAALKPPVRWHIDEFRSLAAARGAEGATSVAVSAHGSAWLFSIEADTTDHHGGIHRGVVGPIPLQPNREYNLVAMSAYFVPGQSSVIHTHSGPEAWWVLEGEQCLRTTRGTIRARAGQGALVAEGDTMQLVATGAGARRSLVLILRDANKPASFLVEAASLKRCDP